KDGTDGTEDVYKKFGASTTWMGKLLYRLDAGRNGGCPVLAVGITPSCVRDE
ncbi:restriction endonuclease, partial [Sulfitobacter pseudonitzschiae]|nr:restriction endonuclease [Pseudosulfitobacter pseudonitzschiae]